MTPFLFGDPQRALFGAHHPAAVVREQRAGVVLCNPFGQEAIRTHRLFRVLAERLARSGVDVLRFDYYGTGDSAGDDDGGDLDGWALDLHAAHRELVARCAPPHITWMGARLGSAVVLRAAARAPSPPVDRLVLYEPVIDGAAYAQMLREQHVHALEQAFSVPDHDWRARLARDADAFADEAIGFAISPALRRQVRALSASTQTLPQGPQARVVVDPGNAPVLDWIEQQRAAGTAVALSALVQSFDWISDEALRQALVPAPAIAQLVSAIDG